MGNRLKKGGKKKSGTKLSDIGWSPNQYELADKLGITQPAVSELYRKGVLTKGASEDDLVRQCLRHFREMAAGRKGENGNFDLATERARLAARQAEEKEIELAERRGDLLPKKVTASVFSFHNGTIRARLLSIPNRLKAQHPDLPTEVFLTAKALIHEALTELSHVRFPTGIDRRTRQYFLHLHATTQRKRD
jgi:phage terminase Nu1 subunit (DNA packaging protein)